MSGRAVVLSIVLLALVGAAIREGSGAGATAANETAARERYVDGPRYVAGVGPVPLVRQVYRNNCETAALSMILAAAGTRVDQRVLQRRVERSGPLDPVVGADGEWVWGAPGEGFVGRVRGGGVAGGFGVYQGPIRRLAASYGVRLDDISRTSVETVVARLRAGRPVLAWIGLSEGPYRRWRTPDGRRISVNLGEHTVVLVGVRGTTILVNDPLTGTRRTWSRAEFAKRWSWLGYRALAL